MTTSTTLPATAPAALPKVRLDWTPLALTPLHFAMTGGYDWLAWEQVTTVLPVWEACAVVLREAMPQHHYSWIAVAVALLTQRQGDRLVVKVLQRAMGVAAGVMATEAIASRPLPGWALVIVISALAATSPWLRKRSYVAYTAATTPLILLLTSGGGTIPPGLLIDRLVATLIAAGLVIIAFLAARRVTPRPSPDSPRPG